MSPARFPGTCFSQTKEISQTRFSSKCFQEEVSRKRCPSKVPSKLVPKQCFQEEVRFPNTRFPRTGSQVRFPEKKFPGNVSRKRFPSKVPRNSFSSKVARKRFSSKVPRKRFARKGSQLLLEILLGTSSSWERLLKNLFLQALFLLGTLRRNGSWDLAWERFLGTVLASGS